MIVYDDDEKLAPSVATSLLNKDVENVIMLSGGKYIFILFIEIFSNVSNILLKMTCDHWLHSVVVNTLH